MKKILATALCCLSLLTLAVPVHAANGDDQPETTVGSTEFEESEVVNAAPAALSGEDAAMPPAVLQFPQGDTIYPIDVRYEMLGAIPYITKVYELEEGTSAEILPQSFEQDNYTFSRMEVLKKDIPGTVDTKAASKSVVAECEKEDTAALIATLAPTVEYSQNGYSGTLQLDAASITFSENGTESYSYRVTDTREYPGLSANDMAYIPKTVTKNGVTLDLEGVEWQVTRTDPTDGGLVPTMYTAIASYSGSGRGSKVSGYMATVNYTGEVEKVTPGKVQYTLVYRGVEIVPEVVEEPEASTKKSSGPLFPFVLLGVLLVGGIVSGGYILYRKRQQRMDDLDDGTYLYGEDGFEEYGDPEDEDDLPEPDYGYIDYPKAAPANLFDVEDSYRE